MCVYNPATRADVEKIASQIESVVHRSPPVDGGAVANVDGNGR